MFEWLNSAIENILTFFSTIWDFLVTIFEDIVFVVKSIGSFMVRIPRYIGFFPPAIIGVLSIGLGIAVIYKVLGRD